MTFATAGFRWIGALLLLIAQPLASPRHDLPDGFVERAMAVQLLDRVAVIDYRIGLNPNTMRSQLEDWGVPARDIPENRLVDAFGQAALIHLPQEIDLDAGDGRLKLQADEFTPIGIHDETLAVRMTCRLPDEPEVIELEVHDRAFAKLDGAVRHSFQSTGRAMLRQSPIPLVLARATRHVLQEMSPEERNRVCHFAVQIVYASR